MSANSFAERCPYCGRQAGVVWVHGHGQCSACGTNVDECCRGETYPETILPVNNQPSKS
jgi:hypothetical protein